MEVNHFPLVQKQHVDAFWGDMPSTLSRKKELEHLHNEVA